MTGEAENWRWLARMLRIVGAGFCIVLFLAHLSLLRYYSAHRPLTPQPEVGQIVSLDWTHPTRFGTAQDEQKSHWLFDLFFLSFGILALGEIVRIYKLRDYSGLRARPNLPWNHKPGP